MISLYVWRYFHQSTFYKIIIKALTQNIDPILLFKNKLHIR